MKIRSLTLALTLSAVAGCASTPRSAPRLAEADHARESPAAHEAAELAPQAFAHAEEERAAAHKALDAGDELAAQIDADRALAAYDHAFVLARLARATHALDEAKSALADALDSAQKLAASRAQVDQEGESLEKQLIVAREAAPIAPSGPVDPKREFARLVAARALLVEARLLCGSARLLGVSEEAAKKITAAEKEVSDLDAQIDAKPTPAPIDATARARARCLESLTLARRDAEHAKPAAPEGDALLAELSASGGLDPARDERGVVITLRDVFDKGAGVTAAAQTKLAELGRVAAAHPGTGVQVVVHDATMPSSADATLDTQRADAIVKALVAAGAPAAHVHGDTAGGRAPVVDPNDLAHRARNARVEIVFITR